MTLFSRMTGLLIGLSVVASCAAVGPDYARPNVAQSTQFAFAASDELRRAAHHHWWKDLGDPVLDRLIARALKQNLELRAAEARIAEARALLGTVGLPSQISGDLSVSSTAARSEMTDWVVVNGAEIQPTFVIDLFGQARRERESALSQAAAAEFGRPAVRLAVILEVTSAYIDLRQAEAEIAVRKRTIGGQARIIRSLREKLEVGDATRVDVERARAELAASRAAIPQLEANRDANALRIAALLAEQPGRVVRDLKENTARQPRPKTKIDIGVPAELLRNRPDVRAAEAELAARVAEIGVAEAELYPSLRLSGAINVTTDSSIRLGPTLSLPILNRGVLKARKEAARARAAQAQVAWRQSILDATEEVQVALVRALQAKKQLGLFSQSVAAQRRAVSLSREAFELQSLTLSELLTAELNAASAQISVTNAHRAAALAWAQLHIAVGNGWYVPEDLERAVAATKNEARVQGAAKQSDGSAENTPNLSAKDVRADLIGAPRGTSGQANN